MTMKLTAEDFWLRTAKNWFAPDALLNGTAQSETYQERYHRLSEACRIAIVDEFGAPPIPPYDETDYDDEDDDFDAIWERKLQITKGCKL